MLKVFTNEYKVKGYHVIITELEEKIENLKEMVGLFLTNPLPIGELKDWKKGMPTFEEQINEISTSYLLINRLMNNELFLRRDTGLKKRVEELDEKIAFLTRLINLELSLFHHPELIYPPDGTQAEPVESECFNRKANTISFNEFIMQLENLSTNQKRAGYTSILNKYLTDSSHDVFISKRYKNEIASDLQNLPQLLGTNLDEREEYWFWHSAFANITKRYILDSFYLGMKTVNKLAL